MYTSIIVYILLYLRMDIKVNIIRDKLKYLTLYNR